MEEKSARFQNIIKYTNFNINMIDFVTENQIASPTSYLITTSLKNKYTYIFKKKDKWNLLYKWKCTIGKKSTPTVTGVFNIEGRVEEFGKGNYSVKYATRIIGEYYYHSILYNTTGAFIIDGRLGMVLSHGCIRLATKNAKWIYDNIPDKTTVIIN